MTHIITANNVNDAFSAAWWYMRAAGKTEATRNGPVLVAPGPVITEYMHPIERVLFNSKRDANPVFHLMEALWMIAGDSRLDFLVKFNSRMELYGENGVQWGAYGKRWTGWFGNNQIQLVIYELRKNPESRRAVIGMWDPSQDLAYGGLDLPCNTTIYFDLRRNALNMTVCCRSNDLLWGCYGANAVHFSILQEVIAHELGACIGIYRQFSNNFHVYTELPQVKDFLANPPYESDDYYKEEKVKVMPILVNDESYTELVQDCRNLVDGKNEMITEFMTEVAVPLRDVYLDRKIGKNSVLPDGGIDWNVAFCEWVQRRENKDEHQ